MSKFGYDCGFIGVSHEGIKGLRPHHVNQVHGTTIVATSTATDFTSDVHPDADGIFTTRGHLIAVKTADCLPVVLASSDTTFAMAVHAGWRGLTKGILNHALSIANQHDVKPGSIIVAIGPAISLPAFEVGPEVVDALRSEASGLPDENWTLAVAKGENDRWHVDLQVAAAAALVLNGIHPSKIEVIRSCTRDQKTPESPSLPAWHSYRRDGKRCGSNWTWIQRK